MELVSRNTENQVLLLIDPPALCTLSVGRWPPQSSCLEAFLPGQAGRKRGPMEYSEKTFEVPVTRLRG